MIRLVIVALAFVAKMTGERTKCLWWPCALFGLKYGPTQQR